jgi:hypothetical protein
VFSDFFLTLADLGVGFFLNLPKILSWVRFMPYFLEGVTKGGGIRLWCEMGLSLEID